MHGEELTLTHTLTLLTRKTEMKMRGGVVMMKMMMTVMLMCAFTVSLLMMTILVNIPCVDAAYKKNEVLYKVGDSDNGWKPNVNYVAWAKKYHFHVGDFLYFGYDKSIYINVLQVSKADYETCRSDRPISISRGTGRDVFNITSAKSLYFLSDGGYCFENMRLAVTVDYQSWGEIIAPAAAPFLS